MTFYRVSYRYKQASGISGIRVLWFPKFRAANAFLKWITEEATKNWAVDSPEIRKCEIRRPNTEQLILWLNTNVKWEMETPPQIPLTMTRTKDFEAEDAI